MGLMQQIQSAWSAFSNPERSNSGSDGGSYYGNPFAGGRKYRSNSVTSPVFNRIALDVASVDFQHIIVNPNTQEQTILTDDLSDRLTLEANIDQTGRAFIQDAVNSMFEEGVVALVPIDTDTNVYSVNTPGTFNVQSWRVGRVTQWNALTIKVEVYNDHTGQLQQIEMPKRAIAIIQNPLYSVINAKNSTLERLIVAMQQLDSSDARNASGKLNLLFQLPYAIKNDKRKAEANERMVNLEDQMSKSQYGAAYIDATEKVTQLNRAIENNLPSKVDELRKEFFNQIGLTSAVFDGTADEVQMKNYYSRTVDIIVKAFIEEMTRVFISKTARSQGHKLVAYRDPFTLVTTEKIADMAKTMIDARMVRPNEMRPKVGLAPIPPEEDPIASTLANPNVDTVDSVNAVQDQKPGVDQTQEPDGVAQQ